MELYHSSHYTPLWKRQGKLYFLLLVSQETQSVLEFIILLRYHHHYHRHPEVNLPQVLTVSGFILAFHLRTFHLCDLELFRSVGRYSVLCVIVG